MCADGFPHCRRKLMVARHLSGIIVGMLRWFVLPAGLLLLLSLQGRAQQPTTAHVEATSAPPESPDFPDALPVDAAQLLADVKDNVFSFDDPAFYWACRFVSDRLATDEVGIGGGAKDSGPANVVPMPWRQLIERPGDYRGRCVIIEGFVLRSSAYDVENRPGLSRLYQLDLGEADTRAITTVVLTRDPGELPARSHVRVSGYFVKVRAFRTNRGEIGTGPLLVGYSCRPLQTPEPGIPGYPGGQSAVQRWLFWGVAALAFVWFIMRGRLRRQRRLSSGGDGRRSKTKDAKSEDDLQWLLDREGRDLLE